MEKRIIKGKCQEPGCERKATRAVYYAEGDVYYFCDKHIKNYVRGGM